ncbi:MFS general substrate transporter [Lophiostoma macrostomum CBS 122681]|uniref:MFS general substrate transporter n=1 Tax=Lophiostoma macrostomum CBS 122681 TaxID=1314788 RepID=A0A6A6SL27_9PLEO|nr:MFS general substrate transporter [Lophiostoma macrostomum CBS 122681]
MGAKASVTPIYGAEVSPAHLRGALVMNWQLFDALGLALGFAANLMVSVTGDYSWRFQVASVVIPTICLLSLVWTIPESGRWLLKKGRYADAFNSFCAIRPTPLQAAAELFYADAQLQAESEFLGRSRRHEAADDRFSPRGKSRSERESAIELEDLERINNRGHVAAHPGREARDRGGCLTLPARFKRIWDIIRDEKADVDLDDYQRCAKYSYYTGRIAQLFRIPRIRRATTAALVMMISQQLCGINILQFYSTTFFHDPKVGSDSLLGPGLSFGFGLANFIFTFPIYHFIDTRGRRFLLLASYPGMIFSMLGACLSYTIDNESRRLIAVVIFLFTFVFFYSWGQGPVPFAYSSEVFPQINREAGMSFVVFANLFGAGILALVVPQLTPALSHSSQQSNSKSGESRLLGIFTGLNVIALILIFFFVPETAVATRDVDEARGQGLVYISLEELNYIFQASTGKHIEYQMTVMIPWARDMMRWKWRRFVGGKKEDRPEEPEPLFTWIQAEELHEMNERTSDSSEQSG